jgi:hypothetical protein
MDGRAGLRAAPADGASPATPPGALRPRGPPHGEPVSLRAARGACRSVRRTRGLKGEAVWMTRHRHRSRQPCAAPRPSTLVRIQTSQRRHPPQPDELPTTSSPPLAGDQGGTVEESRGTVRVPQRGASTRSAPVGSAPQIGETPGIWGAQAYAHEQTNRQGSPAGRLDKRSARGAAPARIGTLRAARRCEPTLACQTRDQRGARGAAPRQAQLAADRRTRYTSRNGRAASLSNRNSHIATLC